MSEAATAAASPTAPAGDNPVTAPAQSEFLFRVAERFGLPVVVLLLVLWWARHDVVQPLLTCHFQAIETIVEGQQEHTKSIDNLGRKLDELISISKSSQ